MQKRCDRSNTSFADDINNIIFRGNGPNITILEQCQPDKKDKNWWKKNLFPNKKSFNLDDPTVSDSTVFLGCNSRDQSRCDNTYDSRDQSRCDNTCDSRDQSRCDNTCDSRDQSRCDNTCDSRDQSRCDNTCDSRDQSRCDNTCDSRDQSRCDNTCDYRDKSRCDNTCDSRDKSRCDNTSRRDTTSRCDSTYDSRDRSRDQSRCSRITECDESRDDCSEISSESRSVSCSFISCVKEPDSVTTLPQIFVKDAVFGFPGDIIDIIGKGFSKRGNPRILFDGIDGIDVEVVDCERIRVTVPYQIFGPIKFLQYVNKCDQSELQNLSTCNAFLILQPNTVPNIVTFLPQSVSISATGFTIGITGNNFTSGSPVQVLLIGQYKNRAIVFRSASVNIIDDNNLTANFNEIAIKNVQGFTFYLQVSVGKLVSPVGPGTFTFTP
jgi:hypothetical protein